MPRSNTQNDLVMSGVARAKAIGRPRFSAACRIALVTLSKCAITTGLLKRVSFEMTWTGPVRRDGGIDINASMTACTTNVLSLPPENPMIQGSVDFHRDSRRGLTVLAVAESGRYKSSEISKKLLVSHRPISDAMRAVISFSTGHLVVGNTDRKSTRLNSSHERLSRMPSSA